MDRGNRLARGWVQIVYAVLIVIHLIPLTHSHAGNAASLRAGDTRTSYEGKSSPPNLPISNPLEASKKVTPIYIRHMSRGPQYALANDHLPGKKSSLIEKIMGRVEFKKDNQDGSPIYKEKVEKCVRFLIDTFGPPLYSGKIVIRITKEPILYARMTWSAKNNTDRIIQIHENHFHENGLKYLVHELFHALYQLEGFLVHNPDFIIEGLAMYAEFKYAYRFDDHLIEDKIRRILNIVDYRYKSLVFDFNLPFGLLMGRNLDFYYLLSGLFFFSQHSNDPDQSIQQIIRRGSQLTRKISFAEAMELYHLKANHDVFSRHRKITVDLSKSVDAGMVKRNGWDIGNGQEKRPMSKCYFISMLVSAIGYPEQTIKDYQRQFPIEMIEREGESMLLMGPFRDREKSERIRTTLIADANTDNEIWIRQIYCGE